MLYLTLISTHGLQLQKKRNARMKDALEEALVLSHSYVKPFFAFPSLTNRLQDH